jgi:hypothetical protein
MKKASVALIASVGLCACQPTAPIEEATSPSSEAPTADAPIASSGWDITLSPVLTLSNGEGLSLSCEEAKGEMRLAFEPAWEKDGPFDRAVVAFGATSFPVAIDTASVKTEGDRYRPVYLLPANADTVTAVMMANNIRLLMTNQDGEQERAGVPADNGAFDMFATTCAQINGLR